MRVVALMVLAGCAYPVRSTGVILQDADQNVIDAQHRYRGRALMVGEVADFGFLTGENGASAVTRAVGTVAVTTYAKHYKRSPYMMLTAPDHRGVVFCFGPDKGLSNARRGARVWIKGKIRTIDVWDSGPAVVLEGCSVTGRPD